MRQCDPKRKLGRTTREVKPQNQDSGHREQRNPPHGTPPSAQRVHLRGKVATGGKFWTVVFSLERRPHPRAGRRSGQPPRASCLRLLRLFAGAFPFYPLGRALPGRGKGRFLSAGRALLGRHGLKTPLAALRTVLLAHAPEVFQHFRRHSLRHALIVHLTPVRFPRMPPDFSCT